MQPEPGAWRPGYRFSTVSISTHGGAQTSPLPSRNVKVSKHDQVMRNDIESFESRRELFDAPAIGVEETREALEWH